MVKAWKSSARPGSVFRHDRVRVAEPTLAIGVLLAVGLGCATQHVDPRLGQQLPEVGLVVGVGQVDGREWMVGASLEQNLICGTLFVAGARQTNSCSERETAGRNDVVVSIAKGQPNLINGLTSNSVVSIETTGRDGSTVAPTVSLDALGLPGRAFGLFVPNGAELRELSFVDGAGKIVERRTLPTITVEPGARP
jgi:hypothetical protein